MPGKIRLWLPFTADPAGELDVLGLDCNALRVNGADVRVLKDFLCRGRSNEDPSSPTLRAATAPRYQVGLWKRRSVLNS